MQHEAAVDPSANMHAPPQLAQVALNVWIRNMWHALTARVNPTPL